jgi:hypothetical protein
MTPKAKYSIADTFKLTNMGLVFVGQIQEGNISIGDIIEFSALNTHYVRKIVGVSIVKNPEIEQAKVALMIKCTNEVEIDVLRNWQSDNALAMVYEAADNENLNPNKNKNIFKRLSAVVRAFTKHK